MRAESTGWLLLMLAVGCGGTSVTDASDVQTGGEVSLSDVVDVPIATDVAGRDVTMRFFCETTEPGPGSVCDRAGFECGYSSNTDLGCRRIYRCMNGRWEMSTLGFTCGTPPATACPDSPPSATPPTTCTLRRQGCSYPDGRVCVCADCVSCGVDSGVCTQPLTWQCTEPPMDTACPRPLPNPGIQCTTEGTRCSYGPLGAGVTFVCREGHWNHVTPNCV